jgi:hypothetical protein
MLPIFQFMLLVACAQARKRAPADAVAEVVAAPFLLATKAVVPALRAAMNVRVGPSS